MKKVLGILLVAALSLGLIGSAMAVSDTGSSSVTITFSETAELAVSGIRVLLPSLLLQLPKI